MTLRLSNDVIIIQVLPKNSFVKNCNYSGVSKKILLWKFVIFIVIVLRGSVVA